MLTLGGATCVVVDPRDSALKRRQRKQLRRRGHALFAAERVEFGTQAAGSEEATGRLCGEAGLIVGLHPDQAARQSQFLKHRDPFFQNTVACKIWI